MRNGAWPALCAGLTLTLADPASGQAPSPPTVNCRLHGGYVVPLSPESCDKESGQRFDAAAAFNQSADQLYAAWAANYRTNHEQALAAGKQFLAAAPADQRAGGVRAWIQAYEKVRASDTMPATDKGRAASASSATTGSDAPGDGPTLEETKRWIAEYLLNAERAPANAAAHGGDGVFLKTMSAMFDRCTLKERTSARLQNGALAPLSITHREMMIIERSVPFDRVDPVSIRATTWTGTRNQAFSGVTINGAALQTSSRALAITQSVFENDGSYEAPVNGNPFSSRSFFPYTTGAKSGIFFQTTTHEDAARLVNALKRLAQLCGGKVDPF